jgi:hypothetical protein
MAPNPSAPGKAGISERSGADVSVTLVFVVSVGVVVTTGFGTGKQPIRFTETNIRSPISRNKSILGLFVINLPLF